MINISFKIGDTTNDIELDIEPENPRAYDDVFAYLTMSDRVSFFKHVIHINDVLYSKPFSYKMLAIKVDMSILIFRCIGQKVKK